MSKTSTSSQFTELISQLFGGEFKKVITDSDIKRVMSQPNVFVFTERLDGKIVGMAVLYVIELFSRAKGMIEEVVTLEEYRNRGIGTKLINMAIDRAFELGITCVELNVREDNRGVQEFYEKLGFYDRKNKTMRLWVNKK